MYLVGCVVWYDCRGGGGFVLLYVIISQPLTVGVGDLCLRPSRGMLLLVLVVVLVLSPLHQVPPWHNMRRLTFSLQTIKVTPVSPRLTNEFQADIVFDCYKVLRMGEIFETGPQRVIRVNYPY